MAEENNSTDGHAEVFRQIAEHINRLSPEERAKIRTLLGEYTHDMKHTLGLVLGANSVLLRDAEVVNKHGEMLEIIEDTAKQLNVYVDILVNNLPNRIEIEE